LERPEFNLTTKDIKGSQPNVLKNTIITGRRLCPLNPIYELSKVDIRPPTPPKFIRDSIKIDVRVLVTVIGYRWSKT